MAAKEFPLSVVIRAVDRVTAPMRGIQGAIRRFDQRIGAGARGISDRLGIPAATEATKRLGTAMGDLGSRAAQVTGVIAGIGTGLAALGLFGVKSLVDTASTFERYQSILETIEGSQEAAKKSLDWVSDFAQRTPYELNEVMESFVKLRAYGIDPTNGTLATLGDTAAAMGKPVMDAVEAIADAMTGENERLKEFGIRASKEGDRITYEYTKDGKTMTKVAQASNRAMIQATLMAIWNDRYSGAMDKLSGTWGGMMSNLSDQWQRFKLMIMQSGPFELLRTRLANLLSRIDAMAKSGELQALAQVIGDKLVVAFDKAWQAGEKLVDEWPKIQKAIEPITALFMTMVDHFGLAETIIGTVAVALVATLVPALYAVTTAVYAFTTAIVTNPIGLIITAVVAAAAALVYFGVKVEDGRLKLTQFGETVVQAMKWTQIGLMYRAFVALVDITHALKDAGAAVFTFIKEKIDAVTSAATQLRDKLSSAMPEWVQRMFAGGATLALNASPAGAAIGAARMASSAVAAQQSNVRVQVDMNNLPPGTRVRTEESGAPSFELNQGFAFGG